MTVAPEAVARVATVGDRGGFRDRERRPRDGDESPAAEE